MNHVVQFRVMNPHQSFSDTYKPATRFESLNSYASLGSGDGTIPLLWVKTRFAGKSTAEHYSSVS